MPGSLVQVAGLAPMSDAPPGRSMDRKRLEQRLAVLRVRSRLAGPNVLTPSGSGNPYNALFRALGPGLRGGG